VPALSPSSVAAPCSRLTSCTTLCMPSAMVARARGAVAGWGTGRAGMGGTRAGGAPPGLPRERETGGAGEQRARARVRRRAGLRAGGGVCVCACCVCVCVSVCVCVCV
jgi:hypothetical protein